MIKKLLVIFILLIPVNVFAQQPPTANSEQMFAFDYLIQDFFTYQVDRFERKIDSGDWLNLGIPPVNNDSLTPPGANTLLSEIPALSTGIHTVEFKACNVTGCGLPLSLSFNIVASVPPIGVQIRLVNKPPPGD